MIVNVYTKHEEERGDFMKCKKCGHVQLLKGSDIGCKNCESDDLYWADENFKFISARDLEYIGYTLF